MTTFDAVVFLTILVCFKQAQRWRIALGMFGVLLAIKAFPFVAAGFAWMIASNTPTAVFMLAGVVFVIVVTIAYMKHQPTQEQDQGQI